MDVAAASAIAATFLQWLPPISAVLGIIWFLIQIWESKTLQTALVGWRERKRINRLKRLRAKAKIVMAKLEAAETVRAAKVEASEVVMRAKAAAVAEVAKPETDLP